MDQFALEVDRYRRSRACLENNTMRFKNMERTLPSQKPRGGRRAWLSGLAITLTTIIALFGFWRLSPGLTFVVACLALVGLVIAWWIAGSPKT